MSNTLAVDAGDLARTLRTLDALPRVVKNRYCRIALNAAGGVVKHEVESRAPRRWGFLAKSQAVKVTQKRSTKDWQMTVGANRKKSYVKKLATGNKIVGFFTKIAVAEDGSTVAFRQKKTRSIKAAHTIKPARYAHLAGPRRQQVFMTIAAMSAGPRGVAKATLKLQELLSRPTADWNEKQI